MQVHQVQQPIAIGQPVAGHPSTVMYAADPSAVVLQPGAVVTQSAAGSWMMRPAPISGCPPGLEYLTQVDQLLVQQQVEMLEAFTGFETANKYRVFNSMGQQCYYAFEESGFCMRLCCGTQREFMIHITDNANQEVMRIFRPFKCCAHSGIFGCCACCNYEIVVESPAGTPIGYAASQCYLFSPSFVILDAARTPVFDIEGPCMMCPRCPCDYDFNVYSRENGNRDSNSRIGRITKQWSGFAREAFTDADNFGVTFPRDMDVRLKATMLGVLFLIDFMFFEQSNKNDK